MISDLLLFVTIGFAAQIVDGAIGMAYGLVSTSVLLSFGIPITTASASVHAAEVFTTVRVHRPCRIGGWGTWIADSSSDWLPLA